MGKALGIVSLIFGIIGLCCGWIPSVLLAGLPFLGFSGFIFPAVAIICGILGIIFDDSKGMPITGLVLGVVSIFCIAIAQFLAPILAELFFFGLAFGAF